MIDYARKDRQLFLKGLPPMEQLRANAKAHLASRGLKPMPIGADWWGQIKAFRQLPPGPELSI